MVEEGFDDVVGGLVGEHPDRALRPGEGLRALLGAPRHVVDPHLGAAASGLVLEARLDQDGGAGDLPILVLEGAGAETGRRRLDVRGRVDDVEVAGEPEVALEDVVELLLDGGGADGTRQGQGVPGRAGLEAHGEADALAALLGMEVGAAEQGGDADQSEGELGQTVHHCLSVASNWMRTPLRSASAYSAGRGKRRVLWTARIPLRSKALSPLDWTTFGSLRAPSPMILTTTRRHSQGGP